ncbi:C(2)H(2) zinc finger protein [Phytophthora megakarya]|uniref:C(2)H(2) zinc finger protein n=1 Tax=Phytophthora megakarya TaxID=4795 RepID=A0A225W3I2_9STRA|nr:C(2)H(2) zinc finger protein [Phytophthora megakarya]
MSSAVAASTLDPSPSNDSSMPPTKRQKLSEDSASTAENDTKDGVVETAQKAGSYPNIALSLQKDPSWMLSDDSFGGLGPMPSMNTVLEKRTSSQFSISSLLPSSVSVSTTGVQSTSATRAETAAADAEATTDNEGQGSGASETTTTVLPTLAEGSGGNTKYMDPTTGDYMYPENVKPMSFYDKQRLVQKITMLPSQYLRGLMDVISKYQPDTVRQIDDDGYAFDLGQMNENTVWAISDYVKESMIELDGYIKSLSQTGINLSSEEDRQAGVVLTATSASSSTSNTVRHLTDTLALNTQKMSAITNNENQNKFLEQVEMYSKPKVTKSRVKPSKKHECPTCSKQFRGRSELQNHIRTHTGEKPLKCSYAGCTKRYAHSSNLRAHERTHAGIKPYTCHYDGCGKSFAHSVSLKEHIWMHAGFQPYVCPYEGCQKKFTQVSNFARHKKTHEKEERSDEHSVESDN